MSRVVLVISVVFMGLAATLCACGGDSETTVSKSRFLVRGNRICWEAIKAQEAVFQKAINRGIEEELTKADRAEQAAVITEISSTVDEMVEALAGIGSVKGDEGKVDEILAEYESASSKLIADPDSYGSGEAFRRADAVAGSYGLRACAGM